MTERAKSALEAVKKAIEQLARDDRSMLRPWLLARFDVRGNIRRGLSAEVNELKPNPDVVAPIVLPSPLAARKRDCSGCRRRSILDFIRLHVARQNAAEATVVPDSVSKIYRTIANRAGVALTNLHAARHTAATRMLGARVDVRTVAGILGHSSASTTLNVYGHFIAENGSAAVDRLGDELLGAVEALKEDADFSSEGNRMATAGRKAPGKAGRWEAEKPVA